jgi:hypothetical protein
MAKGKGAGNTNLLQFIHTLDRGFLWKNSVILFK